MVITSWATGAHAANGVSCLATVSQYDKAGTASTRTCQFTTDNPQGAASEGIISTDTGSYTISTKQKKCWILYVSTAGGNDVQSQKWASKSAQVTSLDYSNHCTYTVTLNYDGTGSAYVGQTNSASSD